MRITAQIWAPLLPYLNHKIEAACLQRDTYLDRVFALESLMLDEEVPETNSVEAQKLLRKHLKAIRDRKPVNFNFRQSTVSVIDEICHRKCILRDSFFNRVLLFLVFPQPKLFNQIYGWTLTEYWPEVLSDNAFDFPLSRFHLGGPLADIHDIVAENPFWAIRECIRKANSDPSYCNHGNAQVPKLHSAFIEKELFFEAGGREAPRLPDALGFNCYLAPYKVNEIVSPALGIDLLAIDPANLLSQVPDRKEATRISKEAGSTRIPQGVRR